MHVFVYAFRSEQAARSGEREITENLLEGSRTRLLRRGTFVFWLEAPLAPPGDPRAAQWNAAFDAVAAALTGA